MSVQSCVKIERELTHVSLFAQAAYALQAFLDQQVVVIVAGVIEIPDVGAFEPIEIVRDFTPAGIRLGLAEFAQALANDARGEAGRVSHEPEFRSEEHTSELQSLMRTSYAVFCLKKKSKILKHLYVIFLSTHHISYTTCVSNR